MAQYNKTLRAGSINSNDRSADRCSLQQGSQGCNDPSYAIMAHAEDAEALLYGEIELDEPYFGGKRKGKRGRDAAGKVPVFGILSRGDQVFVQVVPNCRAKTLLHLTVEKVRRGSIIYTDRYKAYDSLMCCGYRHLAVDHGKYFANGKVYINGLGGFWSSGITIGNMTYL